MRHLGRAFAAQRRAEIGSLEETKPGSLWVAKSVPLLLLTSRFEL